jgi:glycosyltransferase involved in cell wall biosynthesis
MPQHPSLAPSAAVTDPAEATLPGSPITAVLQQNPRDFGGTSNNRRISILFLVDQLTELGGGERVLLDIAQGLPSADFQTYVVALREHPDPSVWGLPCNIRILNMRKAYGREALQTALRLRRLIREQSIDIVHTFFETSDIFGLLVAKASGVRAVVSSRRDMGILRTTKHNVAYRLVSRYFSVVLTVSEQVRQRVIALDRVEPSSVVTIHNGIETENFNRDQTRLQPTLPIAMPPDARVVSTIANLQSWKGVDVFIRCAAEIHRVAPDVHFMIAGQLSDIELVAQLRVLVTELKLDECLHFLGPIRDVRELLFSSHVFCLLSRSEGFPNVVLEAMSSGVPVVATRVGGTPEAIDDGITGWLTESEDHAAAAERVLLLLQDDILHRSMAEAALNRVRTQFTRKAMLASYVAAYRRVLPKQR